MSKALEEEILGILSPFKKIRGPDLMKLIAKRRKAARMKNWFVRSFLHWVPAGWWGPWTGTFFPILTELEEVEKVESDWERPQQAGGTPPARLYWLKKR